MAKGDERAAGGAPGVERASGPFRAQAERDPASPRPICPFLALETGGGSLGPAVGLDAANRCTAIGEPMPQSGRQQELVCLTAAHANCPRYLRGVASTGAPQPAPKRDPIAPAVIGATLVLLAALAASFGFLAVRGGFNLATATESPAVVAIVPSLSPSAAPSPTAGSSPGSTASPTPGPTSSPPPSPSSEPSATPLSSTPPPATTPPATPTPQPSSNRFALLTKCPSTPDCWIYVIRAGDNLQSIAHYFGVSYNRMVAMNPGLRIPIHPGDRLRMPTPTR